MKYCVGMTTAVAWESEGLDESQRRVVERRALGYLRRYGWAVAASGVCIVVAAGLGLAPALVIKSLLNYLTAPHRSFGHVLFLIGIGILASVAGALVGLCQGWLDQRVSQGIMYELRHQLFGSLLQQSTGFFTTRRSGEVMVRFGSDLDGVEHVVSETLFALGSNVVVAASTLALMFALDWRLTLLALVAFPLAILPTRRAGRANFQARSRAQAAQETMTSYLQETLGVSSMFLVKVFGRRVAEHARFRTLNDRLRALEMRGALVGIRFEVVTQILRTAGPLVLLLAGGWLAVHGQASVGTVFSFATVLVARLYSSVAFLGTARVNVSGSLALFKRLFDYIDLQPEVMERPNARPLVARGGGVGFEDVTFAYRDAAGPALTSVSLTVEPGQFVAIVGPTGAGKTTLTHLVPRLFDPQEGCVRIDGQDVRDLTFDSLSMQVSCVLQDTFLFNATIRDNLLYAAPEATDAQLARALRDALLDDVIKALPDGLETVVGERGHRFSGGEQQRLAIARVILRDPMIMILDEATSSLDSVADSLVQAALRPLLLRRTSLVIAHRLSTIVSADKIAVLDKGRLVEEGSHADLLSVGALYATLYHHFVEPAWRPEPAMPANLV